MMRVQWTVPALADLDSIQDYIGERNPAAASRLINDILDRADTLLSTNPEIGRPGRIADTRELILAGTSYIVAYRLRDTVEILAVMHGARKWPDSLS